MMLALIAALAAAYLGWKTAGKLRAENEALKAEYAGFKAQQTAEAEAQARQREQELQRLRSEAEEVHKLRGEASQLRAGSREVEKLRAENQKLRGDNQQMRAANATATAAPVPAATADLFPRESWAFAGYASPEAALVSAVWAMREGNPRTYLESLTPEEQTRMAAAWQNKSEAELAAKHQQEVASITGVRILDRQALSPDEVLMTVLIDGTGRTEKVSMKRVGTDWKFGGFRREPAK